VDCTVKSNYASPCSHTAHYIACLQYIDDLPVLGDDCGHLALEAEQVSAFRRDQVDVDVQSQQVLDVRADEVEGGLHADKTVRLDGSL
jgi:hypothetical protein